MIAFSLSSIFSFLISLNFWTDDEINLLCCSLLSNIIENNLCLWNEIMFGKLRVIEFTKFCLSSLYAVHSVRKWNSSSIFCGQNIHVLSSGFKLGLWYLPLSISKLWSDSLNLLICCLALKCNLVIYSSMGNSCLYLMYVLILLCVFNTLK